MRLFVAAPLPESIRNRIEVSVAAVRGTLPAASWTRAETYHLTLAFIGEAEESKAASIGEALRAELTGLTAVPAQLGSAGFFPTPSRPRVAWLAVEPQEPIRVIAGRVRQALRAARTSFDEKPFKSHVTLARIKERWSSAASESFVRALGSCAGEKLTIDRVVLYVSKLSSKGATHTALETILLQEQPAG